MKKLNLFYNLTHMFFWCGYAIAWSYTAVFLQAKGYNSQVVGMVTGIGAVISVLLQPFLANLIAKNKKLSNQSNVILLKIITVVIAVLIMPKLPGRYTAAVLFTILTALEATIPSILSSIAMECVNSGMEINYGAARGMGSIAYAFFSLFLGYAVSFFGEGCLLFLYVGISILTVGIVVVFQNTYKKESGAFEAKTEVQQQGKKEDTFMFSLLKEYSYLKYFLTASVLLFMSHNMVCVFLPQIIQGAGGDSSKLGIALFISAGVEFPVMSYFVKLSKRISVDKLLILSAVFFGIKSLTAMFAGEVAIVFLAQFLQFGGFALFTPASVYFINLSLKEEDRNVGQALLGACTLGLGGTFGNVLGGIILENAGLFALTGVSTLFCVIGTVFMIISRNCYLQSNLKKV